MSGGAANAQWGGRFESGPSAIMRRINASIGFDRRMWRQDIRGSLAHAAMLARAGVLQDGDEAAIRAGLQGIAAEIEAGRFPFTDALEDIHMNIEARLTERVGEAGKRLHTGRSRNDQVATDFRLWVRDAIDGLDAQVQPLVAKQGVPAVTASFPSPLSRDLRFSGLANAFQRTGFVEVIRDANIRGLSTVGWTGLDGGARLMPLFLESLLWQLGAFAAGLLAAFGMFGRNTRNYR